VGTLRSVSQLRVRCAGGIVFDPDGRLLLVRRGRAPDAGRWSIPGGRCLPGEAPDRACVREVAEETGLAVSVVRHAGQVVRPGVAGSLYVIDDFLCEPAGDPADLGAILAADDAADVRWVTLEALGRLPLTPGLWDALADWELLPR